MTGGRFGNVTLVGSLPSDPRSVVVRPLDRTGLPCEPADAHRWGVVAYGHRLQSGRFNILSRHRTQDEALEVWRDFRRALERGRKRARA